MDHFNMTAWEKLDIFKKLGEENFYVKNSDIYKHFFTNNL